MLEVMAEEKVRGCIQSNMEEVEGFQAEVRASVEGAG